MKIKDQSDIEPARFCLPFTGCEAAAVERFFSASASAFAGEAAAANACPLGCPAVFSEFAALLDELELRLAADAEEELELEAEFDAEAPAERARFAAGASLSMASSSANRTAVE